VRVDSPALALLGDSVITDHISPAGNIKRDSPAGKWLMEQGVEPRDFNSYGSRRGNHEVMISGTFANIRLRNLLAPGIEGGVPRHFPGGERSGSFDAVVRIDTPAKAAYFQHDDILQYVLRQLLVA
jgi:aconitate hydratase